jgi:hypothetical protein
MYTFDDLATQRRTYSQAEEDLRAGLITEETMNHYAYAFRERYRFSDVGKVRAHNHAKREGIRLPLSDLPLEAREAFRAAVAPA